LNSYQKRREKVAKDIHRAMGHHYIVEASGCDPEIISSIEKVQQILVKAAEIAGAQIWSISINRFPLME
jgi:S-adenosylmethionine decarboxylase